MTVVELPPSMTSNSDWPWTEASPPLPPTMPDGSAWPRVSIVTPSFNQAAFIEKTIRSVLLQGYPNLEYIVIDGGSTDGSVEIIRKYEPWLTYWVSEKDNGQCEAINKGFRRASGEIVAWLNSDDIYLSGVVGQAVQRLRESGAAVVYSRCRLVTPDGCLLGMYDPQRGISLRSLIMLWQHEFACPPQPTVFFRRDALDRVGLLDETFHYALDYELWLRMVHFYTFCYVDEVWAHYLVHPASKTGRGWEPFVDETIRAARRHLSDLALRDQVTYRVIGRRRIYRRHYAEQAFAAFWKGNVAETRRRLKAAILADPSCLLNRGIMSLAFRSYLPRLRLGRAATVDRNE